MIKNIIFDYGDVFINLDKEATLRGIEPYRVKGKEIPFNIIQTAWRYEKGEISTETFVRRYVDYFNIPSNDELKDIWNSILLDFPMHRLAFLKSLNQSKKYRLFLLSNTNEFHISWIQEDWGIELYEEFKSQFEQFYLSHEMGMRKPDSEIYEYVLKQNGLKAEETFFIDDTKENTDAAQKLGIHVWNIDPKKEDISELLNRKEFNS